MIQAADCLTKEEKENGAGNPQRMTEAKPCPICVFLLLALREGRPGGTEWEEEFSVSFELLNCFL